MDSSPALLLLLTLGLCCPGIHGQLLVRVRSHNGITQPRVGQRLELECHTDRDSGAFWIRQDKRGTLHFIVFISSLSRSTFGDHSSPSGFEAWKDRQIYRLVVKSFTAQDEGKYFCLMNINQMLFFSNGLPLFLPATPTVAPTTSRFTPKGGTTEDPNPKTPDPGTRMQEINFFCHTFIWIPLAGACLLLLIALVITAVLCQQTRKRRCRCKRAANRKPPIKPRTPN